MNTSYRGTRHDGTLTPSSGQKAPAASGIVTGVLAMALLFGMAGCSDMSHRDKNTAVGAGAGAVAGAVLTGGSAVGTVGGAAVGGLIGNEVGKGK